LNNSKFGKKFKKFHRYFEIEHIVSETLKIYEDLLGLKFREIPEASTWHDDVLPYEVKDKNTGEMLGHIYLDLYRRTGKNGHGSVRSLIKRSNLDGKVVNPAAMLNLGIRKSKWVTLLSFSQVVTFFHEFGHLMHNICTKANLTALSGTAVERDFVEMPS